MPDKKRPRDPNALAYQIMLESTGQAPKYQPPKKSPPAVALGGRARVETLPKEKRSEIAAKMAKTRWEKGSK